MGGRRDGFLSHVRNACKIGWRSGVFIRLALDSSGAVAADKRIDFVEAGDIEIARHTVFQA